MAKGPGGKTVGRVTVRVVPDTSGFRSELDAQLKKELAGLVVKVPVKLDTKNLSQVKKDLRTVSNDLTHVNFTKAFNFNLTPFEHAIGKILVGVNSMQQGFKNITSRVKTMAVSFRDSVNVVGRMRNYWRDVRSEVGSTGKSVTRVLSVRAFSGILGAIRKVGRGFRDIGIAARKGFQGLGNGLTSITSGFGKLALGATKALGALIPTSRAGLILFAVLAAGAPILGLVAGLLAGLPSLGFAIAAPIAAIALGFDGIKKAASVLSPQIDHMKKALSQRFQDGFTPIFEQMKPLIGVVEAGLLKVADGTIAWGQAFTDVITSARGAEQIGNILTNVGKLMQQMTPFVSNLTQAFLTLADAGSNQFGLLAGVMNRFAIAFNAMVDRAVGSGVFQRAIEGLAKVTDALLQLFVRLFDAGLNVMGQIGGPLATLITSIGNALIPIIPVLGSLTNLLSTVLSPVLNEIGTVFQIIGPPLQQLISLLGTAFTGAIQALLPVINAVALVLKQVFLVAFQALSPIISQMTPILAQLGAILADVILKTFQAIKPILGPIINLFGQLALIFANVLVQALTALKPLFDALAQAFADIAKALQPLAPDIADIAKMFGDVLVSALKLVVPILVNLLKAVIPPLVKAIHALVPVIQKLMPIFKEILNAIVPVISAIITGLTPAIKGILAVVKPVFDAIVPIIQGAFKIIKGILDVIIGVLTGDWKRAWDGVKEIFSGAIQAIWAAIKAGFQVVVNFFTELVPGILSALGDLAGVLYDAGAALIGGLWEGIKFLWNQVAGFFSNLGQTIGGFFAGVWNWLWQQGSDIITGLWNGIKSAWQAVVDFFKNIGKAIGDFFAGAGDWLVDVGKALVNGLRRGWDAAFSSFKKSATDQGQSFVDHLKGLWGIHSPSRVMASLGSFLGQGLVVGIESQRNAIRQAGATMAAQVTTGFGTPDLMTNWAKTIEDQVPQALQAVDKFSTDAAKASQVAFSGQLFQDGDVQSIGDQIAAAMDGVEVKMDSRPVGKLVNKFNTTRIRRG